MKSDELVIERLKAPTAPSSSGVKSVLLHVQNDQSLDARLESALSIGRSCSAHLDCVHVTPYEAYVAFDNFGGVFVMNDVIKSLDEEELRLRSRIEEELRDEDVSWDYSQVTGNIARVIAGYGSLADVIVTGRNGHARQFGGSSIAMIGDLLHWSRTPLLIPADNGQRFDPNGTAVVAWDGSFQAANAVRAALGLLKLSSQVRVIQINEERKEEAFPGTRVLEYLSRHGIHAELHVEPKRGRMDHQMVTGMLLAHARAVGASYMVLGAYSHSRIGEYVFGGVTRSLLSECDVPLLIAR